MFKFCCLARVYVSWDSFLIAFARRQVVISGVRNSLNLISFQSEESIAQDSSQYAETGKQDFLLNRMAPWTIVASREYPFYCSCFWWNETRFPLTNSHSKNNAKSTNEQIIYFTTLYLSVMYSEALICALQDRLLILQKVKSKMRRKMEKWYMQRRSRTTGATECSYNNQSRELNIHTSCNSFHRLHVMYRGSVESDR